MFLPETEYHINEDLLLRKEFRMLSTSIKKDVVKNPYVILFDSDKWIKKNMYTLLKSYQVFVGNFFNPSTPYTRLLMKWETGVGKTIGALRIAMDYIRIYNEISENVDFTGSVFVVGFTEDIFKKELLRFPQFGFVSEKEIEQLNFLQEKGFKGNMEAAEQYKELFSRYKRRLTSRKKNGFFKFFGYKTLANRVFITKLNIVSLSREEIIAKINSGDIKLNTSFIDEFANSLLICDEIHRLYNSVEKNNWGVAIELILNYNPTCRSIFLSATPLNNSPTEIVDLLNILLPRDKYDFVKVEDFFKDGQLTKEGANKIEAYMRGRISFVRDVNPLNFASKEIIGDKIPGIDFLKFIRCEMSDFHYNTYKNVYDGTLPIDGIYISDICLPNPEFDDPYKRPGIFRTQEVRDKYSEITANWKKKYSLFLRNNEVTGDALSIDRDLPKISSKYTQMVKNIIDDLKKAKGKTFIFHTSKQVSGVFFIENVLEANGIITHDGVVRDNTLCMCGKPRSEHAASQLEKRGGDPENIEIKESDDKSMVFHKDVWIFDIREDAINFDEANCDYFYDLSDDLLDEIIVFIRGLPKLTLNMSEKVHNDMAPFLEKLNFDIFPDDSDRISMSRTTGGAFEEELMVPPPPGHQFEAARMIVLYGDMDKKVVENLIEKFNKPNNTTGTKINFLIASRFMKESYTLVAVRNIMVMSRPDNISMLQQIIGRAVRDRVHNMLHPDQRHVVIRLFVSSIPKLKGLSYEEIKYKEKIDSNKIVRQIEKIMHESAIDALINKEMIWQQKGDQLDIENYESNTCKDKYKNCGTPREVIKDSTFWAYYSEFEVEYLKHMIKTCFISYSPVWKYIDLYKMIREPPFPVTINTKYVDQELFNVALDSLIYKQDHQVFKPVFMDNEIIHINDSYYTIVHYDEFYYLANYDIENKEILIDVESYSRQSFQLKPNNYSIKEYIFHDSRNNYVNKKERFINQWTIIDIKNMKGAIYSFGAEFHSRFIEEVISDIFLYYTKGKSTKNISFYLKMLEYYELFNIIAYVGNAKKQIAKKFENLVTYAGIKQDNSANLIKEKIAASSPTWISTGMVKKYNDRINYKVKGKVRADYLPIGHFFSEQPRFFINGAWITCPEYFNSSEFKENDFLIGYEERSDSYMDIKFKIRSPIHHIKKHADQRLIERGSGCTTKNKKELIAICNKLNIKHTDRNSTHDLCDRIKMELMYREMKARSSGSNIKWFYMFFENAPTV